MTFEEMAQYLTSLAVKADNEDDKVKLSVIAGVLTYLAEKQKV
jgi:hypothetical protein